MTEPTLLELIEQAALDAADSATRFRKLGAREAGAAVLDEFAARLRAAAERLRSEMTGSNRYRYRSTHALEVWMALERINGGPLAAPSPATCGTCGGSKVVASFPLDEVSGNFQMGFDGKEYFVLVDGVKRPEFLHPCPDCATPAPARCATCQGKR